MILYTNCIFCICVSVCLCVCTCTCVWKPEFRNISPSVASSPCFLRGLSMNLQLTDTVRQADQRVPRSLPFSIPSSQGWSYGPATPHLAPIWVLESELWSWDLSGQYFIYWTISQSLNLFIISFFIHLVREYLITEQIMTQTTFLVFYNIRSLFELNRNNFINQNCNQIALHSNFQLLFFGA